MKVLCPERMRLILAIAVIVPAGFLVKFWVPGEFGLWCNMYGAGMLYEIFWVLALRLAMLRLAPAVCGIIIFIFTCILEFMQLWHPLFPEIIRRTVIGSALVGTGFDLWDFPHYAVGSALGVLLTVAIQRRSVWNENWVLQR